MVFQEPKIELIAIDLSFETGASQCVLEGEPKAGLQTCTCTDGQQDDMTNTSGYTDCDEEGEEYTKRISRVSSTTKSAPKNVVGFDMTFDK